MKQQSLGMSIHQALEDMAERCHTPSVRPFVRTAGRGESLGVSIGPVLRELSSDQRRRRRQAAREKMQKAPVKMIFPLMFLIMPALMIVLMYPAGLLAGRTTFPASRSGGGQATAGRAAPRAGIERDPALGGRVPGAQACRARRDRTTSHQATRCESWVGVVVPR